jgi:hypothetical protein
VGAGAGAMDEPVEEADEVEEPEDVEELDESEDVDEVDEPTESDEEAEEAEASVAVEDCDDWEQAATGTGLCRQTQGEYPRRRWTVPGMRKQPAGPEHH